MKEELTYDLANRYFDGALSEEERKAFDTRLETDETFAQWVSEYMVSVYLLRKKAKADKKKEFIALYQEKIRQENTAETLPKNTEKIRSLYRWFIPAAAALILVSVGYFLFKSNPVNQQELFAEYKSATYTNVLNEKNRAGSGQFEQAFDRKDFSKALGIAQSEFESSDAMLQPIWLERQGFCYWELNSNQKALTVFSKLQAIKEIPPARNPALWYTALTHLSNNDKQNATTALMALLAIQEHSRHADAKALLQRL